ncbi:MAG: hypothetical protein ABI333_12760 [bacterium]
MMDGEHQGPGRPTQWRTTASYPVPDLRRDTSEASFGSPILFDLTSVRGSAEPPAVPQVYYLATAVDLKIHSSPWWTVLGFGAVILAGTALGLLLAWVLLPV